MRDLAMFAGIADNFRSAEGDEACAHMPGKFQHQLSCLHDVITRSMCKVTDSAGSREVKYDIGYAIIRRKMPDESGYAELVNLAGW